MNDSAAVLRVREIERWADSAAYRSMLGRDPAAAAAAR